MYKRILVISFLAALLLVSAGLAANGVNLAAWTVDGGGGRATGGEYALEASIGQPDAGTLAGGSYTLYGGFLQPHSSPPTWQLFLPLVVR